MECADNLKKFIIKNFDGYTEHNVLVGSLDISRYELKNLCLVIPESTKITDTDIGRGFNCETKITVSFLFRGENHPALIKRMEETAEKFQREILGDYSLGTNVTDIEPGEITYFYDCGTVEKQATGLEIELTITETKDY